MNQQETMKTLKQLDKTNIANDITPTYHDTQGACTFTDILNKYYPNNLDIQRYFREINKGWLEQKRHEYFVKYNEISEMLLSQIEIQGKYWDSYKGTTKEQFLSQMLDLMKAKGCVDELLGELKE